MCWKKSETIKCYICRSVDGKSKAEKQFETMLNQKYMDYPLLPLSQAYQCRCKTLYAHNKCLLFEHRCPSCQKLTIPSLYIQTKYDYYLKYLLDYLKKDTKRIYKMYKIIMCYLLLLCLLLAIMGYNDKIVKKIIVPKSNIALLVASFIGITFGICCYILTVLDDYFKKYWLYNSKTERAHVLIFQQTVFVNDA